MIDQETLEIFRWVAIGHEEEITEYGEDIVGYECAFHCGYYTAKERTTPYSDQHSERCLMRIARKKLSELNHPLRMYTIEYAFTYTPTPEHKQKHGFLASYGLEQHNGRLHTEYVYTINLLKFNPATFIQEKVEKEQKRLGGDESNFVVSINPKRIIIHDPQFLYE